MPSDTFNIHAAKTQLSELIARVEAGEEIVIARANRPVARLVAIDPPRKARRLGDNVGGITWVAPDFDAPLAEDFLFASQGPTKAPSRKTARVAQKSAKYTAKKRKRS